MINKLGKFKFNKIFESLGTGVMEYWSVDGTTINPSAITPPLQFSNTPKLNNVEFSQDDSPYFGL
jgi:hypothetical protein